MTRRRNHTEEYRNEGPHNKYFTVMLNMADDDLDPFEYRLLGHYIRVCGMKGGGVCRQSVRTVADVTHMSIPKVIATRNALLEKGWIRVDAAPNKTHKVTVIDRMAENISRYVDQDIEHNEHDSSGDQYIDHTVQNIDRGDQYPANEEEPTKKNTQERTIAQSPNGSAQTPAAITEQTPTTPPRKTRKRTEDRVPAALMNPMKDAIAAAFGWEWDAMTSSEAGQIQKAARELCRAKATPDEVPRVYAYCVQNYEQFGPPALTTNLSKARAKFRPQPMKPTIRLPKHPSMDCDECGGRGMTVGADGRSIPCQTCLAAEEVRDGEAAA